MTKMLPKFKEAIITGGIEAIRGRQLLMTVESVKKRPRGFMEVTIVLEILDLEGDAIVEVVKTVINEGNSVSLLDFEQVFNVTLQITKDDSVMI